MQGVSRSRAGWAALAGVLRHPGWLGAAVILVVFGAKLALIDAAGSDLPIWDQWDAEGAYLYRPYIDGTLRPAEFISPHNEHRILFTRLLALGLLELNGQWDGILQMVANALLHAALVGAIAIVCATRLGSRAGLAAAAGLAVVFAVPAAWENTLSGFQSQFYFLLLFAFLHLAGTALARPGSWQLWTAQLAGGCALFTMASGVASAAAAIALVLLQALRSRRCSMPHAVLLAINLGWLGLGVWLRVDHPGHEFLRASGLGEYTHALTWLLAWPTRRLWLAPLVVLPFAGLLLNWWRTPTPFRSMLLALGGWWLLQVLLLAYARGKGVDSPRYFDLLTLGLAVAWVAWIDWLLSEQGRWRWPLRAAALGWVGVVTAALVTVQVDVFRHLAPSAHAENQVREAIVREQVEHPSPEFLRREPGVELPYPWADRLAQLLADPSLRRILPPSIRLPLSPIVDPTVTREMGPVTLEARGDVPPRAWGRDDTDAPTGGSLGTRELRARTSRVLVRVTGSAGELRVEPQHGQPRVFTVRKPDRWLTWAPDIGSGPFRVYASTPPQEWLLFTAPVEIGGAGWIARGVAARGGAFVFTGAIFFVAGLCLRLQRPRATTPAPPRLSSEATAAH